MSQGQSMLEEVQNRTCRRGAYGYNKGLVRETLDKRRLWVGQNIVFPMTCLGSQVIKKVRLSMSS